MLNIKENFSEDSNIAYLQTISTRTQVIYLAVLSSVLITFAMLPFITVQVSVSGRGIINSLEEKILLQAPINGRVSKSFLKDNHLFAKGDTILVIDSSLPSKQDKMVGSRLNEIGRLKSDIKSLLNKTGINVSPELNLKTKHFLVEWQQFSVQIQVADNKIGQAKENYSRHRILFDHKVISASEFEKFDYAYKDALLIKDELFSGFKNQLQSELNELEEEEFEKLERRNDFIEKRQMYVVRAPITGSITNLNEQVGSYVFSGQKMAELSPDTLLTAICYIAPADIGLVFAGQATKLQIDAFNYNQWGLLDAEVIDISNDVLLNIDADRPVFKVKCKLLKSHLKLKNGYQGRIKKGMTFTAHFMVTKTTIYQLIYDKMDSWLNPRNSVSRT